MSRSLIRLSVCMTVTIMHCAQTAEDIDTIFFYDSHVSLPDSIKIWLTSVNLFLPQILPQGDPSLLI